jgi:hypothetical protein
MFAVQNVCLSQVSDLLQGAVQGCGAGYGVDDPDDPDSRPQPVLNFLPRFPPGVAGLNCFDHEVGDFFNKAVRYLVNGRRL